MRRGLGPARTVLGAGGRTVTGAWGREADLGVELELGREAADGLDALAVVDLHAPAALSSACAGQPVYVHIRIRVGMHVERGMRVFYHLALNNAADDSVLLLGGLLPVLERLDGALYVIVDHNPQIGTLSQRFGSRPRCAAAGTLQQTILDDDGIGARG
jgi:hypothetical protein